MLRRPVRCARISCLLTASESARSSPTIEPLFRSPLSPCQAIQCSLRCLVGDVQVWHDANDSVDAYRFYPLDP